MLPIGGDIVALEKQLNPWFGQGEGFLVGATSQP